MKTYIKQIILCAIGGGFVGLGIGLIAMKEMLDTIWLYNLIGWYSIMIGCLCFVGAMETK